MHRASNSSNRIRRPFVFTGSAAQLFIYYRRRNAMKLAKRVLLGALAICVLSAVALGQTPRGEKAPNNLSPSIGTGGSKDGPSGLFTPNVRLACYYPNYQETAVLVFL